LRHRRTRCCKAKRSRPISACFDNVQAFAKALRGALGREPSLAALEVSENTGSALVRSDDGGTRSFAFVEGKLSEPDPSPLRDESPPAEALAGRFTFASIDFNRVRAALKAQINMLGLGAEALSALAREAGTTPYLHNVVVEIEQIRLTTLDPSAGGEVVTYRYNRSRKLVRLDAREAQITRCADPFIAAEFDWTLLPTLVEQAFVALGTDRSADVRVDVE
jgi:hypothetical protein